MAIKSYIVTQDCNSPYVSYTGHPKNPNSIKMKRFRKGEIVNGELKHANNKPAFVLVEGSLVLPLESVKEIVSKEITSNANGDDSKSENTKKSIIENPPKIQYIDGVVIGAILGAGAIYLAEKQGWIAMPEKKNKIYGAIAGALLSVYLIHRFKLNKPQKQIEKKQE